MKLTLSRNPCSSCAAIAWYFAVISLATFTQASTVTELDLRSSYAFFDCSLNPFLELQNQELSSTLSGEDVAALLTAAMGGSETASQFDAAPHD